MPNQKTGGGDNRTVNWSAVAGKAAMGAKTIFEPIMPATFNTIGSFNESIKDIRNATRILRATESQRRVAQSMTNKSTDAKKARDLFKSAMTDIENGDYNLSKIDEKLYDDYDDSPFKMPKGDDAADLSSEEILLNSNAGIAQSVIRSSSAQLRGLQESTRALIGSNIKATQAAASSINGSLANGFNIINTTLIVTNQKLDKINASIQNLVEFNNRNTTEFYIKGIDMLNGIGKMLSNTEKLLNPDVRTRNRKFDVSSGFNVKEYINYVKEGIKETLFGSMVGAVSGGIRADRSIMRGGFDLKDYGIIGKIVQTAVPSAIKKPLENIDKTVVGFFDQVLKRITDAMDSNPLLAQFNLGAAFGNRRERLGRVNLSGYMKDAISWNGLAQKALVEVIPEYLASIDATLAKAEKRYYDYDSGKFYSQSEIKDRFDREYIGEFQSSLMDSFDNLTEIANGVGRSTQATESLIARMEDVIDDIVNGTRDAKQGRREMEQNLRDFGVGEESAKKFIQMFQNAFETALSNVNDKIHDIGVTQSVYRNIMNQHGNSYFDTMLDRHKNKNIQYRLRGRDNPRNVINQLQTAMGINDPNILKNKELRDTVYYMMQNPDVYTMTDIMELIRDASISGSSFIDKIDSFTGGRISRVKNAINRRVQPIGDRIERWNTRLNSEAYEISNGRSAYRDRDYAPMYDYDNDIPYRRAEYTPTRRRSTHSAASSYDANRRRGQVSNNLDASTDAAQILSASASQNFDTILNQSQSDLDNADQMMFRQLETAENEEPATTVSGAIVQSNNMNRSLFSVIVAQIKGFGARLFGKDGFLRKIWESETRKKITGRLFTNEDAIFGKQYRAAKKWLGDIKTRTGKYIGDKYNYLYDNTMQYLYGDSEMGDYVNNERYKNNNFLSKTINLRYRRQKKDEDAQKKSSINQSTESPVINQVNTAVETSADAIVNSATTLEEDVNNLKTSTHLVFDNVNTTLTLLSDNVDAVAEEIVGSVDDSIDAKKKSFRSQFNSDMKDILPKAAGGVILGAGVGALNNSFSLLGSMFLPGGPVAGAIVGGGLAILSQTEAFKRFMFGPEDEDGKRKGGLINENLRKGFKKAAPYLIGGAVLGGLKSIIGGALGFDGGLGIMGMQILPGGILGGAMLGSAVALLKHSNTFKDFLFGKQGEDGRRQGKMLSNAWNASRDKWESITPGIKNALKGLGIGALTGAVLSNMGYLPAMLSMGGPIGMGVVGLGIGIASSTKKFNEWMFGTEEFDENGNPTGRRTGGLLGRVTNLIKVNTIEPISKAFRKNMLDLIDWGKLAIKYPFEKALGPIMDSLGAIKDSVVDYVKEKFEMITGGIKKMIESTLKFMFNPILKLIKFVGTSALSAASIGTKVALSPITGGLQVLQFLTAGKRRKEYLDFYKDYYFKGNMNDNLNAYWAAMEADGQKRNFMQRASDRVGAFLGIGPIADAAREGYNLQMREDGKNHFGWRDTRAKIKELKENRKIRRKNDEMWDKIDKYRTKLVNKEFKGREVDLNDFTVEELREKFAKMGIDPQYLQTSQDIMDLLYRRNEFRAKVDPYYTMGTKRGANFGETPEQAKAREETSKFQENTLEVLNAIAQHMGAVAKERNTKEAENIRTEQWRQTQRIISKKMKKMGMRSVDLSDPELMDYDLENVSDDILLQYKYSSFGRRGDFKGYLDSQNITRRSEYKSSVNSAGDESNSDEETPINPLKKRAEEFVRQKQAESIISPEEASNLTTEIINNMVSEGLLPETERIKVDNPLDREHLTADTQAIINAIDSLKNIFMGVEENTEKANEQTEKNQAMQKEFFDSIKETSEENLNIAQLNADTNSAMLEVNTSGELDNEDVKKKKGKSFGSRIASKFNFLSGFLGIRKKEHQDAEEADESAEAQALGDEKKSEKLLLPSEMFVKPEEEEEKSPLGKFFSFLGSGFSAFASSKVGGGILTAAKTLGRIGLVGGIALSIVELIRPGTAEQLGAGLDQFNEDVASGKYSKNFFVNKFEEVIDKFGAVIGKYAPTFIDNAMKYAVDIPVKIIENIPVIANKVGTFIADHTSTIIDAISAVITEIGVPLATAMIKSTPKLIWEITKASAQIVKNVLIEILPSWLVGDKKEETDVDAQKVIDDETSSSVQYQKNVIATGSTEKAVTEAAASQGYTSGNVIKNSDGTYSYIGYDKLSDSMAVNDNGEVVEVTNYNTLGTMSRTGYRTLGSWRSGTGAAVLKGGKIVKNASQAALKYGGKVINFMGRHSGKIGAVVGAFAGGGPAGALVGGAIGKTAGIPMRAIGKTMTAAAHPIDNLNAFADKLMNNVAKASDATRAKEAAEVAGRVLDATADAVAASGDDAAGEVLKKAAQEATEKVSSEIVDSSSKSILSTTVSKAKEAAKKLTDNKVLRGICEKFGSLFGKNSKIGGFLSSIASKFIKIFDTILTAPAKLAAQLAEKAVDAAAKFGLKISTEAASAGILALVNAGVGAIMGAMDAENLFQVKKANTAMTFVSAIMEGLLSISFGVWFEFAFIAIQLISGKNVKLEIAEFLYKLISGYSEEAIAELKDSQEELKAELALYNALNDTNLSITEYNEIANKTTFGKIVSGAKSKINSVVGLVGWTPFKEEATNAQSAEALTKLLDKGYTTNEILEMTSAQRDQVLASVGYGKGAKLNALSNNNLYSQGNPKWANMPIGRFPDGSIATMSSAGCGPTALAAVANQIRLGGGAPGVVTPADMAKYASENGYISAGGANAGLFTLGAAKLGLRSNYITNSQDLATNLISGKPVVLTGRSSSGDNPYTQAGHIVVANGYSGGKTSVLDPMTGKRKLYNLNDISKNTENAWGYSVGYGENENSIKKSITRYDLYNSNIKKVTFGNTILYAVPQSNNKYALYNTSYQLVSGDKLYTLDEANDFIRYTLPEQTKNKTQTNNEKISEFASDYISGKYFVSTTDKIMNFPGWVMSGFSGNDETLSEYVQGVHDLNNALDGNAPTKSMTKYITPKTTTGIGTMITDQQEARTKLKYPNEYKLFTTKVFALKSLSLKKNFSRTAYDIMKKSGYFLKPGVYGTVEIKPQMNAGNYSYKTPSFTTDWMIKVIAAAAFSNNLPARNMSSMMGDFEKWAAVLKAAYVCYGLEETVRFFGKTENLYKISSVPINKCAEYLAQIESIFAIDNLSSNDALTEVIAVAASNGGLNSLELLRQYLESANLGFFGKLNMVGKILLAQKNALLNSSDFWTEFGALTTDLTPDGTTTSSSNSTGTLFTTKLTSESLNTLINNPNSLRDELLGKTGEQIYREESSNNYACVSANDGGKPSIGPYQANAGNASTLLNNLASATGLSNELKQVFRKYSPIVNQRTLTSDEATELRNALSSSQYQAIIRKSIDSTAIQFWTDNLYNKFLNSWYDNQIVKDPRSLVYLASMANIGPAYIYDKSKSNSWISNWSPTTKSGEYEKMFNLMRSGNTFFGSKSIYQNRINRTFTALKNYQFKRTAAPGELQTQFNEAVGYGDPALNDDANDIDVSENSLRLEEWSSGMSKITDAIFNIITDKYGLPELFGLTNPASDISDGQIYGNSTGGMLLNMSSSPAGSSTGTEVVTRVSGTDRDRFIQMARSQLGYLEKSSSADLKSFTANPGSSDYQKYSKELFNSTGPGNPWCNSFVSWCAKAANVPSTVVPYSAGTQNTQGIMAGRGQYFAKGQGIPEPGDVMFSSYGGGGAINHIGIVESVSDGSFVAIEGNTSNGTGQPGVYRVNYGFDSSHIVGYARPGWTGNYESVNPSQLLQLGYGSGPKMKIESFNDTAMKKFVSDRNNDPISVYSDLDTLGFGPGMRVDAGFDMTNTDGKLEKIFMLMNDWYHDSKTTRAATSSETKSTNFVNAPVVNNTMIQNSSPTPKAQGVSVDKYKDRMIKQHAILSYRQNIRN